jgi:hypothetical protein
MQGTGLAVQTGQVGQPAASVGVNRKFGAKQSGAIPHESIGHVVPQIGANSPRATQLKLALHTPRKLKEFRQLAPQIEQVEDPQLIPRDVVTATEPGFTTVTHNEMPSEQSLLAELAK